MVFKIFTTPADISSREIVNANSTVTLEPELFGDIVQKVTVKLENISFKISEQDIFIFAVETIQSGKPIGNIIEKRYENDLGGMNVLIDKSSNRL